MLKRLIIALLVLSQIIAPTGSALEAPAPDTQTLEVVAPVATLPAPPLLLTSYMVDTLPVYLQIYNSISSIVPLADWQIRFDILSQDSTEIPIQVQLNGYIEPHSYLVIARSAMVPGADLDLPTDELIDSGTIEKLSIHADKYADDVRDMQFTPGTRYDLSQSDAGNYTKTSKYAVSDVAAALVGHGYYDFEEQTAIRIVEFLANSADCAPLDTSIECFDFVKIINQSTGTADLANYRLRIGYGNQDSSISNTVHLDEMLAPGGVLTINTRDDGQALALSATGGNIWLEDKYGLRVYEETIVGYDDVSSSIHQGQSRVFAAGGEWSWAMPIANGISEALPEEIGHDAVSTSSDSTLKPCADNQYRNPETNRCRLIETVTSVQDEPCPFGQYRSTETNRCRSITATLASQPKPCADNQYRNPDTGRCKLLASEDMTSLKPCAENQERNPETNRCRKTVAASIPLADYPTKSAEASVQKSFSGWYAIGTLLLLGAGYALWEWRQEISVFARRVGTMISRHD